MKNFKIFTKLFLSHTAVGLLSVVISSFIFYIVLSDTLIQRTVDQLSSINILKKNLIDNYFLGVQTELELLFKPGQSSNTEILDLITSSVESNNLTKKFEQQIRVIKERSDFDNIILINNRNQKIYSFSNDSLLLKFSNTIDTVNYLSEQFYCIDASGYDNSYNPVLLYVVPITIQKRILGFVVIKDNFQKIQKLLRERTGMGNTGESYLVGSDYRMRSSSHFFPNTGPLSILVQTEAAQNAFKNLSNKNILIDYRGLKVVSVYSQLKIHNLKWAIISEIDFGEAMKPILKVRNYLVTVTLIIIVIILITTFFISNAISKPILYLKDIIVTLSKGIIPNKETPVESQDEIGKITDSINQLMNGMKRTTNFANEIGAGNFNASFTPLSDKDTLGVALINMRNKLKGFNEREIKLVRERTVALIEAQENERKRIIQDLHDGVGQLLTVVRLRAELLEGQPQLNQDIKSLINEIIGEVRRISYQVMPHAIIDFGLEAALKGLCENLKKYAQLSIDFKYIKECDHELNFEINIAVFRIVQEGLNNSIKHAEGSHVDLHVLEKEDEIYFIIRDNGKGFKEEASSSEGIGLRSMRERAKLLNGNMDVHTAPGKGTTLEVHIPLPLNESTS